MHKMIHGGTFEVIDGLTCWIPPMPKHPEIAGFGLPHDEQFWRRTDYPDWWEEKHEQEIWDEEQANKKKEDLLKKGRPNWTPEEKLFFDSDVFDDDCEAFRAQEWKRRKEGYWFFNNGVATYITGAHYYYANWIVLNNGYPKYMEVTRKNYYFRQYCLEDPKCFGYLIVGIRGVGKTTEEGAFALENLTKAPGKRIGVIQSKSENDAKIKVFSEKIVPMYQGLPDFFQPIADHGSSPEGKLSWKRPSVTGKDAKKVTFGNKEELRNVFYPTNAKEKALDGGTFAVILEDELGKTDPKKEADVSKRAQVNYNCVWRFGEKVGIIQSTTTVEEMDAGGKECKIVWDNSDQAAINLGHESTVSGRYRRFYGALDADPQFMDKHGFVDRVKAKKWHDEERAKREHDPRELASWVRKMPYDADEAFYESQDQCQFNAMILNKRKLELKGMTRAVERGNLEWSAGPFSDVVWRPNEVNGWFSACWLPSDPSYLNKVECYGVSNGDDGIPAGTKLWRPKNTDKIKAGADPIQYGMTVDKKRSSKPVTYAKRLFDPAVDWAALNTDGILDLKQLIYNASEIFENGKVIKPKYPYKTGIEVMQYDHRPGEPILYYEAMLKFCFFWGCQLHIEAQKAAGLITYFKMHGCAAFIMNKVELDPSLKKQAEAENFEGTAATVPVIQNYTGLIATDVEYFGHRYFFSELIDNLLKFDPKKTTEYDYAVAKGYTEMACAKTERLDDRPPMDIKDIFDVWDNTGDRSTLI